MWTREEHNPNTGPDVLLNLSVSPLSNTFHELPNLMLVGQLFLKSRGSSVICGRVIRGRVLELYQELTDPLVEACILSAIFALRYLSRDLAANVEQIDVSSVVIPREAALTVRVLSIGNLEMDRRNRPQVQCRIRVHTMSPRAHPCH